MVIGHLGKADGAVYALDAFFVLSGFLITGLMLRAVARYGAFNVVGFWGRRFRRLFPAMLVAIGMAVIYAYAVADRGELRRIRGDGISSLFYVNNWYAVAQDNSYADIFRLPSPLQHLWTLSIEEQFYLVWPLVFAGVLWLLRKKEYRQKVIGVLAASLAIGTFGLVRLIQLSHDVTNQSRLYYGTDTRSFALAIGSAMAAMVVIFKRPKSDALVRVFDKIGLTVVIVLVIYWLTARVNPAHAPIQMFVLSDVLVLLGVWLLGDSRATWMRKVLSFTPLVMIGVISYGIYLFHWPLVVWLTPQRLGFDGIPRTALVLVLAIIVAALSFVLIEQPIMKGALPRWQGAVAIPISIAVLAGLVLFSTKDATSLKDELAGVGAKRADGLQIGVGTPYPAPPNRPHVLVVGDSVAATLGQGFMRLQHPEKISAMDRGAVGCGIMDDDGVSRFNGFYEVADNPACDLWPDRWKTYIDDYRPNVALLVIGNPGAGERKIHGTYRRSCTSVYRRTLKASTIKAIKLLASKGGDVYVATAMYLDVKGTYVGGRITGYGPKDTDCVNEVYREAVKAVPGSRILDLNGQFCTHDGACKKTFHGIKLRQDGVHIEGDAAVEVSKSILDQLAQPPALL